MMEKEQELFQRAAHATMLTQRFWQRIGTNNTARCEAFYSRVLGVEPGTITSELSLNQAFRKQVKIYHPDFFSSLRETHEQLLSELGQISKLILEANAYFEKRFSPDKLSHYAGSSYVARQRSSYDSDSYSNLTLINNNRLEAVLRLYCSQ